jgi:hypothetical protein
MARPDPHAGEWYDVRVDIDRGEGATPRFLRGMTANPCPLRKDAAERLAAEELRKPYLCAVAIVQRESYLVA